LRKITRVSGAFVAIVFLGVAPAVADSLGPDDFATGRAITTRSGDPLQTLLIDLLVYRGSVGTALADLRVFNAQGEVVPHAIRTLGRPGEASPEPVAVPVFRLPETSERPSLDPNRGRTQGWIRSHGVEVELSEAGAIVRVNPSGSTPSDARPSTAAVLLDLTGLPREAVGLELELGPTPAEFLAPLRIEVSDDLVRFRKLTTDSALARLDQNGHHIERSDVTFRPVDARYLVLSVEGRALPVEIRGARARLAPVDLSPPRHETRVVGVPVVDEPGNFVFDLGGAVPADRVQFALPQPNAVARVELLSSENAEGPWTRHHTALLYRLEREPPLRNDPLAVPARRHRFFKLVVSPQGGGLGAGVPTLEASWHPEQLLFVQRGEAPFSLGYGRAGAEAVRFTASELLRTVGAPPDEVPRETALLGQPHPVGDPGLLEPRVAPIPRRTVALWAFLILAVASVLFLSLRLLVQIRSGEGGPTSDG
jgi:hypothetical protein